MVISVEKVQEKWERWKKFPHMDTKITKNKNFVFLKNARSQSYLMVPPSVSSVLYYTGFPGFFSIALFTIEQGWAQRNI